MFFGPSISEGFWQGFGRVLGDQNPHFSLFFGCFLKLILKHISEDEKMDQNFEKTKVFRFLVEGRRWSPGSWGEKKRGVRSILSKDLEIRALKLSIEINLSSLARFAPPEVGRRIEGPRGGHRRLPHFGKAFGAVYASVVCTHRCTDRWRSMVGRLRLGRLCPFAFSERL